MTTRLLLGAVSLAALSIGLFGCGGAVGNGSAVAEHTAGTCLKCHGQEGYGSAAPKATKANTGRTIEDEWKGSKHAISGVAGCVDCHGDFSGHAENICGTCHGGPAAKKPSVAANAEANCLNCHDPVANGHTPTVDPAINVPADAALPLQYKSLGYVIDSGGSKSRCIWCHNPHDNTVTEKHKQWAKSGHGELAADPWLHYDFKVRGTDISTVTLPATTLAGAPLTASQKTYYDTTVDPKDANGNDWFYPANPSVTTDCVRCHTTTGYINYVSSGFKDIRPWGVKHTNPADPTSPMLIDQGKFNSTSAASAFTADTRAPVGKEKQVLYCNACHDTGNKDIDAGKNYGYWNPENYRRVPQVTGYYNLKINPGGTNLISTGEPKKLFTVTQQYPDVNASNICLACHTGRESGETLNRLFAWINNSTARRTRLQTPTIGLQLINTHYLAGGGTVFKTLGYEFTSGEFTTTRSYANSANYLHDKIGRSLPESRGTGELGPCVTCHLGPEKSHTFVPVERSGYYDGGNTALTQYQTSAATGLAYRFPINQQIVEISNEATCGKCHGQLSAAPKWDPASLEVKKDGFRRAMYVFKQVLEHSCIGVVAPDTCSATSLAFPNTAGIGYGGLIFTADDNPYFFRDGFVGTNRTGVVNGKTDAAEVNRGSAFRFTDVGILGAAYNYNYLYRENGAFAHNSLYVKRLIYDSIDYVLKTKHSQAEFSAGTILNSLDPLAWQYVSGKTTAPAGSSADRP